MERVKAHLPPGAPLLPNEAGAEEGGRWPKKRSAKKLLFIGRHQKGSRPPLSTTPYQHAKIATSLFHVPPKAPCSEVKPRDLATLANCHQCLAAARHAAYTWSRRCRARPNVETLPSCQRTACPGSGKRVRNAEIATSPPRTRLPVPPRRPARLPLFALGCVGHGLTSARAKPAHTRHASGLGTRRNHPRWR